MCVIVGWCLCEYWDVGSQEGRFVNEMNGHRTSEDGQIDGKAMTGHSSNQNAAVDTYVAISRCKDR